MALNYISAKNCNIEHQVADVIIKELSSETHIRFRDRLGVCMIKNIYYRVVLIAVNLRL